MQKEFLMRKIIGIIVVFFIVLVIVTIFSFLQGLGILNSIGSKVFIAYGSIGAFIFYSTIGGIFISFTSWAVRASWRGITLEENTTVNTKIKAKEIATQDITSKVDNYFDTYSQVKYNDITLENNTNIEKLSENNIYEKVMLEIEEEKKVKATWARAFSQVNGNINQAQALYINLRVEELKQQEEYKKEKNKQKQTVAYYETKEEKVELKYNEKEPSFLSIITALTILFLLYQLVPKIWNKIFF